MTALFSTLLTIVEQLNVYDELFLDELIPNDMSAPTNEQQAEIDKHVNMLVSLGDVDIICDI
ncbi:hypothetical protein LSAT2_003798, partial [Lamellibrachia satsuma]